MPNAVINVERNGGFGASVLSYLLSKPDIKPNLYYEIKDRVFEERSNGLTLERKTKKVKVYGSDSTKDNRLKLMEILSDRMRFHKDKFIAEIIYNELTQLEVKKNGKIEHCDNGHDDQIFSYLWALYVYYYGSNLMENWHITKTELKTDAEFELADSVITNENYKDLGIELIQDIDEDDSTQVKEQIKLVSGRVLLQDEFEREQREQSEMEMERLLKNNPLARKAYSKKYHIPENELEGSGYYDMTLDIDDYYDKPASQKSDLQKQFDGIVNIR